MDAMNLLYCLLVLVFVIVFRRVRHQKAATRRPPGPPAVPFIGHLLLLKNPLHQTLTKLGRRYGPVMSLRFGSRPVVVVSSPAAVEECFSQNDATLANRPRLLFGKHFGDDYSMLSWLPNGPQWRTLRRVANMELLANSRLDQFSAVRRPEGCSLVKELFRDSASGGLREVNLRVVFTQLAMNWMTEMLAGKRYYGNDVADEEEARKFVELTEERDTVSMKPYLGDFFPVCKWFDPLGVEKQVKRVATKRYAFLQKLIDQRRQRSSEGTAREQKKTLLDSLLSLQQTDPEFYNDRTIRGVLELFLIVGTDTVYMTVEWAMALLLNHPNVMRKARDELDLQIGHEKLIEESHLPKLPYLHNILYETLRLYPPAPLSAPHEPSEDCTIGGYSVPRGTMIMTNLWAIHTDPKLWDDPMSFKPERFEGMEGGKQGGLKWIPFGYGRRTCPGAALALREGVMALGMLLQCFDWKTVGNEKVDLTEGGGVILPMAVPLTAQYAPRAVTINLLSQL